MRRLGTLQDILLAGLAIIGAIATTLLMLHVVADVAMRNLFNRPIPATYEVVVNYYMVAMAFVPLAWIEKTGGMVQVEVINGMLSPRMRLLSDILVAVIAVAIYATLAWVTWNAAVGRTNVGAFVMANQTRVITWPAYWLPPLGFGLAAISVALRGFRLALGGKA
jgi:TRAP-type C4-dicarboxylate transport system permease small subunit